MKKKQLIGIAAICLAILLAAESYCGYRLLRYEKEQSQQIQGMQESLSGMSSEIEELTSEVGKLSAENSELSEAVGELSVDVAELPAEDKEVSTEGVEWLKDGYNYLAIGNSITMHAVTSFWWNEIGMAASDADHDYYHIVLSYLDRKYVHVMGLPCNFVFWEQLSHDRDETLEYLDYYLSPDLDLVTVQLAENASDLTTYQEDYVSLLKYIKEKAPNARLLVIGDFWNYENRDELKQNAVRRVHAEYVSLDGIADNKEYYCGLGTVVYDEEGNEHVVKHSGVADHPGDKGMEAIAERVIDALKNQKIQ